MRVLHISGAKGWGGNEQQMIFLFPELEKLAVENVVFGIKNSLLQQECQKLNVTFFEAKGKKLNKMINYRYLKDLVTQIKPDLIHLHTSDSLTVYAISDFLFKLNTQTIFSKKGMGSSSSFLSNLKYNYKGLSSIICVSSSVQSDLEKILDIKTKQKTVVINDCVSVEIKNLEPTLDLRKQFGITKDFKIIGNIGNHSNAKDIPTFIQVVEEVIHRLKRTDIVFVQIGEFSKNTLHFKQLVKEKSLDKHIVFTDKIKNASSVLNQFDIFLMTSQREGGPTSVLEAMLIGTPVISTKVGVVSDVIQDGVNGFIAPIKDYKELSKKIITLLDNSNSKAAFVEQSKEIIKLNFTASFIAKKTQEEYSRVINSKL